MWQNYLQMSRLDMLANSQPTKQPPPTTPRRAEKSTKS